MTGHVCGARGFGLSSTDICPACVVTAEDVERACIMWSAPEGGRGLGFQGRVRAILEDFVVRRSKTVPQLTLRGDTSNG